MPGPPETSRPLRIFLDTSALFAGVWSETGGARMLLRLGEAGTLRLLASSQVLQEIETVVRRKAPDLLPLVAMLLDRCSFEIVIIKNPPHLDDCQKVTGHLADGRVIAEAWIAQADFFVTLDRQHFLDNSALELLVPFPIGTPGDCLTWLRQKFIFLSSP
jgi:predicted nucleic acid-binding protein